jgi:hypothetical protein
MSTLARSIAAMAAAVAVSATATPALCVEPATASTPLAVAAERTLAVRDLKAAVTSTQDAASTQPTAGEARPFLKTGRGKAVVLLLAAMTGYAVYSRYHDRVKSPATN